MLTECPNVKQVPGERHRRWFEGDGIELIVWQETDGAISGFQLCYGIGEHQRALSWNRERGYDHQSIDDGESAPMHYKRTPILLPDGRFDAGAMARRFLDLSGDIDPAIADFVHGRLLGYPEGRDSRRRGTPDIP